MAPLTLAYLIFVLFGTPPYFLAWKKYAKKVRKFATKIASRQNSVNFLLAYLVFWLAYLVFWLSYLIFCWRTLFFVWCICLPCSLWKKVNRLVKSTLPPVVAVGTNIRYALSLSLSHPC